MRSFLWMLMVVALGCRSTDRTIPLQGGLQTEPAALQFGEQRPGSKTPLQLKVSNPTGGDVTLLGLGIENDARGAFAIVDSPTRVAAGASVTLDITYHAPPNAGADAAALVLRTDSIVGTDIRVPLVGRSKVCPPEGCLCTPKTCQSLGKDCGAVDDECGGSLQCGECSATQTCGGGGTPNVCSLAPTCSERAAPPSGPLESTCKQVFPPAAGIPCSIPNPGTQYYLNAATGSDSNSGTSPADAWATLCKAVSATPAGSTLRVATGVYTSDPVFVSSAITVKGGYDPSFQIWDPDQYPTILAGRLRLQNQAATFGGFQMRARTTEADSQDLTRHWHRIASGSLVRNYIEVVHAAERTNVFDALVVSPMAGQSATIRCNDIYLRGASTSGEQGLSSVYLYLNEGSATLDSNRICLDRNPNTWEHWALRVLNGNGPAPTTVTLTNNIIETTIDASLLLGVRRNSGDLNIVMTNNTLLSAGWGIGGTAGLEPGVGRWKLTNNILFSLTNRGPAVDLPNSPTTLQITSSENNLIFGHSSNSMKPTPLFSSGDDTSGT